MAEGQIPPWGNSKQSESTSSLNIKGSEIGASYVSYSQLDYIDKALGISPLHNFSPILFCSGFSIYLFSVDLKSDSWILVNQSKIYQILLVFLNAILIKGESHPARTLWSFSMEFFSCYQTIWTAMWYGDIKRELEEKWK